MKLSVFLVVFSSIFVIVCSIGLYEEFTWSRISYCWPNSEEPPSYIDYRYENNIPMGANVWKDKLFITVPRRRPGIASTLNYVPLDGVRHNSPLIPYPNWAVNIYPPVDDNLINFVSFYRIAIDPCDRLWAIDTGMLETSATNFTRVKPTTIIAIDLNTDKIIHYYELPEEQWRPAPGQVSVTVDVTKDTCDDAYVYIPDLSAHELIVYSLKQDRSWQISHDFFKPEPKDAELSVAGFKFEWQDGIFSTELSDCKTDGFRDLYFHALASTIMYRVPTRILRNETLATQGDLNQNGFEVIGDRGQNSQTGAADIHKPSGTMFLSLVNHNAIGCWNIRDPLNSISYVHRDDVNMIYPSDVKVVNDRIYVLTNRMPVFIYGKLNYDEVNFRLWTNRVDAAIDGTLCA